MSDLVERLKEWWEYDPGHLIPQAAARIEQLEADVKAVLRREEDANRAAMKHLRNLEQERIKSANYAEFSNIWRKKCEALEARVAAADKLAKECHRILPVVGEALDGYGMGEMHGIATANAFRARLAAYEATKEQSE